MSPEMAEILKLWQEVSNLSGQLTDRGGKQ